MLCIKKVFLKASNDEEEEKADTHVQRHKPESVSSNF